MTAARLLAALLVMFSGSVVACAAEGEGYLSAPPVFLNDERDFPVTGMGIEMPPPGTLIPLVDVSGIDSDGFRQNGQVVQPDLSVQYSWIRVGALYGVASKWAVGLTMPWYRNKVLGEIGGEPASGIIEGFGDLALVGKHTLWSGSGGRRLVAAAGIELPTGKDDGDFAQDNAVTNAYYTGNSRRIPLAWQPGSGSVDGYLSLAYGRRYGRFSYVGLVATKLHTPAYQDVRLGNILIAGASGTYGFGRQLAGSLGFFVRSQGNDSYPEAPPPGVGQPALAGTTVHGTVLFLEAGVRYAVANRVVIGVGVRAPLTTPDDGFVPKTQVSIIFYPSL